MSFAGDSIRQPILSFVYFFYCRDGVRRDFLFFFCRDGVRRGFLFFYCRDGVRRDFLCFKFYCRDGVRSDFLSFYCRDGVRQETLVRIESSIVQSPGTMVTPRTIGMSTCLGTLVRTIGMPSCSIPILCGQPECPDAWGNLCG